MSSRRWASSSPSHTAWSSASGTSCPTTAAVWSRRRGWSGRRSIRASRTSWMVSGTARPGPDSPAPPSTTRESSSRKNGFPSAFPRMTSATRSDTASARRTERTTLQAVLPRQGRERDLGDVGAVHPGRPVARPVGDDAHRRQPRRAVHQGGEALLRRRVDPVEVLDDEEDRPPPRPAQDELAQRLEGPGLDGRGRERGERLRALRDAEQPKDVRNRPGRLDPDLLDSRADLGGDDVRALALGDPEVGPEDVENREVGDGAGVGLAPPLQERDPPLGLAEQALAKLVEQARLPDAGFAEQARRPGRGLGARPRDGSRGAPSSRPRPTNVGGRRPRPTPGRSAAISRCTGPASVDAVDRGEVEVAREEGRRRFLDEDRAGLGQPRGARRAPSTPHACRPGRPGHRRGRTRRAPGGRRCPSGRGCLPPRRRGPLRGLVDGRRRQRGPLRRVLDRLQPERRDDARRAHLLDAAAERLDLLDQGLEPAARTEPGIVVGRQDEGAPEEREPPALPSDRQRRAGLDRGGRRRGLPRRGGLAQGRLAGRRGLVGPARPRLARAGPAPRVPGRASPCGTGGCPGRCRGARLRA